MEPTYPTPADWQAQVNAATTIAEVHAVFEQFFLIKKKCALDLIHAEILPIFNKKIADLSIEPVIGPDTV